MIRPVVGSRTATEFASDRDCFRAAGEGENDPRHRSGEQERSECDGQARAAHDAPAAFLGRELRAFRRDGCRDRRILLQDRLLEPAQLVARLEAELVGEELPAAAIRIEGLGLPARAVEREHQLRPTAFSQRVLPNESFQLRDHLRVAAELEVGVDPLLERRGAAVLELRPLGPGDRIVEIGERRTAPEGECLAQPLGGDVGFAAVCFLDELREALGIERARLGAHQVARSLRHDRVAPEGLPQLGYVDLECGRGRVGRRPVPELVDQPVPRDDPIGMQ